MAVSGEMRASDADRDQVLDRLRTALAEGRLDRDEFEDRMARTLAARTFGQLAPLTADLPATTARAVEPAGSRPLDPAERAGGAGRWIASLGPFGLVFALCTTIWLVNLIGSHQVAGFWPFWLVFWGLFAFRGRRRARWQGRPRPGSDRDWRHSHEVGSRRD